MASAAMKSDNRIQGTARTDWALVSIVTTLLVLGTVIVFSASFSNSLKGGENPFYFLSRQLIWVTIGSAFAVILARIPYQWWERVSILMMGGGLLAMLAVITFGSEKWGATRTFFNGSVQPSEPVKIIIVIYISAWLASKGERIRNVRVGLLPFGILLGVLTLLIMLQPSISTAILVVATSSLMFFIAGADMRQLGLIALAAAVTFWLIVQYSSYASNRMEKYLDSVWNPHESQEYQVKQGIEALTRGGLFGEGIGQGDAQHGNLPLSWTDNIFAVIGEETGLIGVLVLTFLFAMLAHRGLRTALRAPDNFGMLLATGITSLLVLQALLHAAVIVSAVPPTGVTLPFISYGGSSIVTTMGAVGILLSIARAGIDKRPAKVVASDKEMPVRATLKQVDEVRQSTLSRLSAYARFDFGGRDRGARLPSTRRTAKSTGSATRTKSSTTTQSAARSTTAKSAAAKSSSRSTTSRGTTSRRS